jgi:FKBP-type peptidyl-prolyl cis-trans isomerase FkpA
LADGAGRPTVILLGFSLLTAADNWCLLKRSSDKEYLMRFFVRRNSLASLLVGFMLIAGAGSLLAAEDGSDTKTDEKVTELKTVAQKASYAMGLQVGRHFRKLKSRMIRSAFMKGLNGGFDAEKPLLNDAEADIAVKTFLKELETGLSKDNQELGAKFLAGNGKKKGVVTTASGLQYIVLKEGDGDKPKATDTVKVHYRGTLLDGTEFDSSYRRKRPMTFEANRVIKGWTEGLQLMKVGSKFKFFIPSELAYGSRGTRGAIGPNATLIFEVELLAIEKPLKLLRGGNTK